MTKKAPIPKTKFIIECEWGSQFQSNFWSEFLIGSIRGVKSVAESKHKKNKIRIIDVFDGGTHEEF